MKNKECWMKYLKQLKPIRLFILDSEVGIYTYNQELNKYTGLIGELEINDLIKIINGEKSLSHLKIEMIEQ